MYTPLRGEGGFAAEGTGANADAAIQKITMSGKPVHDSFLMISSSPFFEKYNKLSSMRYIEKVLLLIHTIKRIVCGKDKQFQNELHKLY